MQPVELGLVVTSRYECPKCNYVWTAKGKTKRCPNSRCGVTFTWEDQNSEMPKNGCEASKT